VEEGKDLFIKTELQEPVTDSTSNATQPALWFPSSTVKIPILPPENIMTDKD